jgi:NADH:ubiquinone oxidoreductase subunit 5 (subunit L)/multisubunit Na+/H+ antiporter MnhA subunit
MLWILLLTPLLGSVLCGVLHFLRLRAVGQGGEAHGGGHAHHEAGPSPAGLVACLAIAVSLGLSLYAWWTLFRSHDVLVLESSAWPWISAGGIEVELALVVDRLSSVMLLVVTGVGFLIHVY